MLELLIEKGAVVNTVNKAGVTPWLAASGFGDLQDKGVEVTPYGLFLVGASDKPIVFEDNVQDLIGKPPVWKESFRLPAAR